jgi:cyclase
MLRPRLIPCLLVQNGGLVKTVNFTNPKYVGDPINAVRIYNEKEVDELVVMDIDATVKEVEPDYQLISYLASECRMPLCYGGGVRTIAQFEKIISLGVEKVAVSSAAVENPKLISDTASRIGSQSVVVVIDVKKTGLSRRYEVVTHNGTSRTGLNPVDFARRMADLGAGEIIVNSVDRDGEMRGYDLDLVELIRQAVNLPLTVLGGAGSIGDLKQLINRYGIIGSAAGSLFVFKGKYRAVLINYPNRAEKEDLLSQVNFLS